MHRSIKQHLVRNAKFTCFSKKGKKTTHTHNNNKPKKTKNKTQKNPGAYNKRNRIRI